MWSGVRIGRGICCFSNW
ncbi:hypothetical protein Goklo_012955 [Gossypium klotzschianum]|uniref:Uncharacterized protein n=1 Tax=Gossypium klotzschianum TaxID=34286 RepID=A0A7J8VEM6_9ROSI|nr:hypothetical protein [Gossypium klotzschianum]